jgi:predicted nucleotidyltransferase component of viral defense system
MIQPQYRAQVSLLLQILPYVAKEEIFALKGGTAINLFVRDLPRLSVDIDLTYLPFDSRATALKNIQEGLGRIKNAIERAIVGLNVNTVASNDGMDVKLNCQFPNAQIKIEVNTTTRGHLLPVRLMPVTDKVQDEFGKFAAINVVSQAELFGGKICAALDRQHPRDLFDVNLLFANEGFSEEIKLGLMAALFSHYKPIHELINPILKDQKSAFESQFSGMTYIPFLYEDYVNTRTELIKKLRELLTENDKKLILSFESGNPDWSLFPIPIIKDLPAINWKLLNIQKLIQENPDKHKKMIQMLTEILE